jgi:hypothetical protein
VLATLGVLLRVIVPRGFFNLAIKVIPLLKGMLEVTYTPTPHAHQSAAPVLQAAGRLAIVLLRVIAPGEYLQLGYDFRPEIPLLTRVANILTPQIQEPDVAWAQLLQLQIKAPPRLFKLV